MDLLTEAKKAAARKLASKSCHSSELKKYLVQKGYEEVTDQVLELFSSYLNDHEWVNRFISREQAKGYGQRIIEEKLKLLGIHGVKISFSEEALSKAINKKTKGKSLTFEEKMKLKNYLFRKGFNIDEINIYIR